MSKASLVKGIAILAAAVFMGAGCAGSGSGSADTSQPSGAVDVNVGGDY